MSITDSDGAVMRAERAFAMVEQRLAALGCRCEVHKASSAREKVFALLDYLEAFVLHVCLALNFGGMMEVKRDELMALLREELVYRQGVPHPQHRRKLADLLDTFASGTTRHARRYSPRW